MSTIVTKGPVSIKIYMAKQRIKGTRKVTLYSIACWYDQGVRKRKRFPDNQAAVAYARKLLESLPDQTDSVRISAFDARANANADSPAVVYLLASAGMVKIGIAKNLMKRLYAMRCSSAVPIEVISAQEFPSQEHAFDAELKIHAKFRRFRSHGEWFKMEPEAIESAKKELRNMALEFSNEA